MEKKLNQVKEWIKTMPDEQIGDFVAQIVRFAVIQLGDNLQKRSFDIMCRYESRSKNAKTDLEAARALQKRDNELDRSNIIYIDAKVKIHDAISTPPHKN